MRDLDTQLAGSAYQGYAYSYPHKTAHRPLPKPVPIRELWAPEQRDALFLYVHIPFCQARCGYCNLFSRAEANRQLIESYLGAVERQSHAIRATLGAVSFARMAVGGGTPTLLTEAQLERVLGLAEEMRGGAHPPIPCSVETSPETATRSKLSLLRQRGVSRISLGVQSFRDAENAAIGRRQTRTAALAALATAKELRFPVTNVDLMYGLPGQSAESWAESLRLALEYRPAELYLYPLYIRSLTPMGRRAVSWPDNREALYQIGRDVLCSHGYRQVSMRLFQAPKVQQDTAPRYCCQDDGMVGLGCGARSYTRSLHYSWPYAMGCDAIRALVDRYTNQTNDASEFASYGCHLDDEDQRRRYLIQSLLTANGLSLQAYRRRFGTSAFGDFAEIGVLIDRALARLDNGAVCLTQAGVDKSDVIGPWLYSERVRGLMESFQWR